MGEQNDRIWPNGAPLNGLLMGDSAIVNMTRDLDQERWSVAERRTSQLIEGIQPNQPSEERRNAVSNYVTRLIMNCFPCKVCTFGSVPLKTYLPDGDIDLTALTTGDNEMKETWANKVRIALECEEKSPNAEFHVNEVQFIQAEVKIIKCLVENIVVDISFNQVGGLCTLCFLEEVGRVVCSSHLFKRSIILIKAWCYYESRILGAHHGLISTYALETLVLYIFHIYNNKFAGPLEVLFRFLEFFSNFDWENYCISLWGPVPINSLPNLNAEPPRRDEGELLLNKSFLDWCAMKYAYFPGSQETQTFPSKFLNVIDPLRTSNNLGRSIGKGNFFRIRSAFAFGAKKLANLLECRKEDLIPELNQFFKNTMQRHGSGIRPDCPSPAKIPTMKKTLKTNISVNSTNGLTKLQFARTRSSPELTNATIDNLFQRGRHNRAMDRGKTAESSNAQLGSDVSSNHSTKSLLDEIIPRSSNNASPRASIGGTSDTNSAANSHDVGFASMSSEEISASSSTLEMRQERRLEMSQEEQDMINLMSMHGFNGQFQLPPANHQLPLALSSLLTSDLANLSLLNPNCFHNLQFPPPGFIPQITPNPYSQPSVLGPNLDRMVGKKINDNIAPDSNTDEDKYNRKNSSGPNFVPVIPTSLLPIQTRFGREDLIPDIIAHTGWTDTSSSDSRGSRPGYEKSRGNNNNRTFYDNSRNRVNDKINPRSPREKWARKITGENPKPVWQNESAQEDSFSEMDTVDWGSTSASEENAIERIPKIVFDQALNANGPVQNPVFPFGGQVIIGPSGQRGIMDNSGRIFIPTGPPIPFYLYPVNVTREMANQNAIPGPSSRHIDRDHEISSQINRDFGSVYNNHDLISRFMPSASPSPTTSNSDERNTKSEILNTDLDIHWQNLVYGRFCQNHAPLTAQAPIMLPQMFLQSHFPDGPGRPVLGNLAPVSGFGGPRIIPLMPFQPGSERVHNVAQRFVEEPPRPSRVGTGTFLPNSKVPYRERQGNARNNQRWNNNYNNERGAGDDNNNNNNNNNNNHNNNNHDERESAKQRGAISRRNISRYRNHHYLHQTAENQSEGQWQTYRNDSYRRDDNVNKNNNNNNINHHHGGGGKGLGRGQGNTAAYNMYAAPPNASVPNGVGPATQAPPLVMVYSYDQQHNAAGYNPSEFRSARQNAPVPDEVIVPLPHELGRGKLSRASPEPPHLRG